MSELRDAITRVHDQAPTGDASANDIEVTCQAALHYADMAVILSETFGPGAEGDLQVEIGQAVQGYIQAVVAVGDSTDVRQLGEAALAPVLERLNAALVADASSS